jgi:hypothetical protein
MAGTQLSDVIDLFTSIQLDYRLISLYQSSGSANFITYVEPWALFALDEFSPICTQDLTYSTTTQTFTQTLTQENKNIIAQIMVKYWLMKIVQETLQMGIVLQDHDFKTYAQSQNLKAKQDYLLVKKEEISQLLQDYAYRHNSQWHNWYVGTFDPTF